MAEKLYREIDENPTELEGEVLETWESENTFQLTLEATKGGETFVFYEGPPTANGRPGIHHVFSRTLKDAFCRYQTMKGRSVTRIAGWDTHGLPVEVEAEKALGISGKPEIEKIGVEKFTRISREHIFTYKEEWEKLSLRIGFWLDYSRAYITCSNEYVDETGKAIVKSAKSGNIGDGKIFVMPMDECIRIRTDETGPDAIG